MSNWQAAEEGDLQDDIDLELDAQATEKDCILFVVDCCPEMFIPSEHLSGIDDNDDDDDDNDESKRLSPFQAAMKCASSVMKNKIISSETDRIGVLCFNTAKSKNPAGFPHILQLQPLDVPDAPSILEMEKYANNPSSFREKFGAEEVEFPFGNVFWTAANIFSDKSFSGTNKRIFLFTCQDNPNGGSESLQRAAKTRGKDLADLGISLELFAIPPASRQSAFNFKAFYASIIPDLLETIKNEACSSKFEELLTRVRRKETRKRALARTEMSLGSGMNLSVKLFSLFMETKKGQYVWMDQRSGKVMTPKTEWRCKETGKLLQSSDFKFSFDYGGEKIIFTKEELSLIYKFDDEIGLKVLGFKPRDVLKTSHNITHSSFVYPDETIIGSVAVFASLLKSCLELNKLILCRWTARRGSPPRLVALLPQAEKLDEIGTQIKAPGFNMIPLPFADDIRHLRFSDDDGKEKEHALVASYDQIDKAKALMSKLVLSGRYNPDSFDNPVLQRHYANLQALALDQEPEGNLQHDPTMPDYDRIRSKAEAQIAEFKEAIGLEDVTEQPAKLKRPAASASADYDCIKDIDAVKSDPSALAKFTVNDLKTYLESVGIKAKRLKAEIIGQFSTL